MTFNAKRWILLLKYRSLALLNLIRRGQFLKAKNYALTIYSMIKRPDVAPNYPIILVVEPGNVCNLSCALCTTGQRDPTRIKTMLEFKTFKRLMDQVGTYAIQLDLYNWGEPFINLHIFKMIKYAKKFKIKVKISTNLNLYTEKIGKNIIRSGLDTLILSIHGGSQETYSKYMIGGDFDKVIRNLTSLVELRKKLNSRIPKLCWRFAVFRHNEHEIETTRELALKMGADEFEPLPMKMSVGHDIGTIKKDLGEKKDWVPTRKEFNIYDLEKGKRKNRDELDCFWPWEIISIGADGTVQPCCVFYNQKFDFGNVFEEPFLSVWNNRYYQISRKVLREKIRNNVETICGPCLASGFLAM